MRYPLLEDKDWGMYWDRPPHAQVMPVSEIYVHQTAGVDPVLDYPTGDDDPGAVFRALNHNAIVNKGYSAVDYSMLVHTGPSLRTTIGEARGQWVPAATLDRNTESKAVCLCGWFGPPDARYPWTSKSSRPPFPQELEAIAEAIVWMIEQDWVVTKPIIRGHRDNPEHPNATACPGDYLERELWQVRMMVDQMQQPGPLPTEDEMGKVIVDYFPKDKAGVAASGGSFTLDGIPLSGEMVKALEAQGWVHVRSDHQYWRAAIGHRNGSAAERMYVGFEDTQDTVKD